MSWEVAVRMMRCAHTWQGKPRSWPVNTASQMTRTTRSEARRRSEYVLEYCRGQEIQVELNGPEQGWIAPLRHLQSTTTARHDGCIEERGGVPERDESSENEDFRILLGC